MIREPGNSRARLAALAAVVAGFAWGPAPAQDAAGDAARGKQLYYDHGCYTCHGYNGQTGARDLVGTGSPIVDNAELFLSFLRARAGVTPLFPATTMPSFPESALSDAEARDILAYIRTFELDAPDAEDVPALRAILDSAAGR